MTPPRPRAREYVGSRLTIGEALRHSAAALRELGDEDLAGDVERAADEVSRREHVADETARRGRDDEITRELPLPLPKKES